MTPRFVRLVLVVPFLGGTVAATDFVASLTESSIAVAQQKKRPGVFQRLFGSRERSPEATSPRSSSSAKRRIPQASGYRTLCVRTCDGYYFPISNATVRKRFKIDETVCKAMYGGAEASLYAHLNGSPAETAVSLKGKRL